MDLEQVRYEAFFDELGHIEKRAMLEKVAVGKFFAGMGKGLSRVLADPKAAKSALGGAWKKGVGAAGKDAGWLARTHGGLKGVWGTERGRALMTAGGLGAGALAASSGIGYLAGRGGNQQNVYVR